MMDHPRNTPGAASILLLGGRTKGYTTAMNDIWRSNVTNLDDGHGLDQWNLVNPKID